MIPDCDRLVERAIAGIRDRADVAVLGLSGGADSSLTAILCVKALGKENVYGVSMPYDEADSNTFNSVSAKLAERIGLNHLVRPVHAIADAINESIHVSDSDTLTCLNKGNARSRARMCVLYGIAHTLTTERPGNRIRVVGTGNLSEDFIGYDTKGGDALADFFPIGDLFKSEVYQLLVFFRDQGLIGEENIDRVPSAGLVSGQTDEKDLGHSYNAMEPGIRHCLEHGEDTGNADLDDVTRFVWERHLAHRHKHQAPPVIPLRDLCK
ncbi:MAG: NAD(+) synthase [Lentisphaerae bacterium]|nr:NAD(+) synthase [Lentisphaerota bacterium]